MSIIIETEIDISEIVRQTTYEEKCWLLRKLLNKISNDDIIEVVGQVVDDQKKTLLQHYFGNSSAINASAIERGFQENILKISKNYISLTKEDEEIIANIAKKF